MRVRVCMDILKTKIHRLFRHFRAANDNSLIPHNTAQQQQQQKQINTKRKNKHNNFLMLVSSANKRMGKQIFFVLLFCWYVDSNTQWTKKKINWISITWQILNALFTTFLNKDKNIVVYIYVFIVLGVGFFCFRFLSALNRHPYQKLSACVAGTHTHRMPMRLLCNFMIIIFIFSFFCLSLSPSFLFPLFPTNFLPTLFIKRIFFLLSF